MPLTDTYIRKLAPGDSTIKSSDGGGLQLWITPTGSKLWYLAYRYGGKQKKLAVGPYPDVTLLEAREKREEAKRKLRDGVDPSAFKIAAKRAAVALVVNKFGAIADELIDKKTREGKAEATLTKNAWLLGIAKARFADRSIDAITAAEVLALLRTVEVRGHHESARRLRAIIGEVFRYAIATARAANDPTSALKGALTAPVVKHHAAILSVDAFGGMLRAIDAFEGQPTTRAALQLLALLFPRPGELRLATWPEFDFGKAVWTIPEVRMKMRRPHLVPLPKQAIAILRQLYAMTGEGRARLLFPSVRADVRAMSDGTLNAALRRLGYSSNEATSHGFRATASTMLNESGMWGIDAIENALAHVDGSAVRRAYSRGAHWEERVRMAAWWADHLDELRARRPMELAS